MLLNNVRKVWNWLCDPFGFDRSLTEFEKELEILKAGVAETERLIEKCKAEDEAMLEQYRKCVPWKSRCDAEVKKLEEILKSRGK